jgi:hypothetical protein
MSENDYSSKWSNNENFYEKRGDYAWMASFLDPYPKILEIGCGNGVSTSVLRDGGHKVLSIERNSACAGQAAKRLKVSCQELNSGFRLMGDVNLLYGDFLDPNVLASIGGYSPDAIILWNCGSYWSNALVDREKQILSHAGYSNDLIDNNFITSATEYMQTCVAKYALTKRVVFQFVERSPCNDGGLHAYFDQIKRSFKCKDLDFKVRETKNPPNGVPYFVEPSFQADKEKMFLCSGLFSFVKAK